MGKGMRAGRLPKKERKIREIKSELLEVKKRTEFVNSVREDLEAEVLRLLTYNHNLDMLSVMFALRDMFGFGKDRLLRTMEKACQHQNQMAESKADINEMLEIIRSETGIAPDELVFEVEVK